MNIVKEVQEKLKEEIKAAVIKAGLATEEQIPDVVLELPRDKTHGDYSTNMAMQLTKIAKKAPKMIAEAIIENFDNSKASIEKIEIAGPGFINFYMDNAYLTELDSVDFESWMKHMGKATLVKAKKSKWSSFLRTRLVTFILVMPVVRQSAIHYAIF